jgi:PTH1 family peptidyl-tRNA hydrolase
VVGLGNPGPGYSRTRHNVGFQTLDVLAGRLGVAFRKPFLKSYLRAGARWQGHRIELVKPLTYMNNSGQVLPALLRRNRTGLEALLVICDTLDLPPGACRLRRRGSSAGHKGLDSIIRRTGSQEFMRLYIGIGRPGRSEEVVDHVLSPPGEAEAPLIAAAVARAAEAVLRVLEDGPEQVMNGLNQQTRG